jgi:xanthine dehydrogenase accessory factor
MEKNLYSQILDSLSDSNGVMVKTSISGEEGDIKTGIVRSLESLPLAANGETNPSCAPTLEILENGFSVTEPVLPRERLIVLGGGHIALALGEFATKCGFQVYVADDRPDFANSKRFPWACGVTCDTFENAIERFNITPYDYVVIITRGHTHDADCLRALLPRRESAYLGMIGSKRRVKGLLEMLAEEGYDKERLGRICTPIGLKIGSVTPEEISISILSQLIAYKRLPEYNMTGRYVNASDLELEMVEYLSQNHDPKAIVTVIGTKGSTPRGAGAKMAVSPTGEITGSIGGGCSESAVIMDAIDIIGTGRYKVVSIDMTGEVAESEGMVCGGIMYALIEDGSEKE